MIRALATLAALLWALPAAAAGFSSLDRETARRLADPQAHRQPTVVALWSSDCVHCKKNLGLLAALARADRRLKVVTVATEAESPALAPLLEKTGISGLRYAYGADNPEALAYALDPAWAGELPRTLLFDGKGGRRAVSGALTEAQVREALGVR